MQNAPATPPELHPAPQDDEGASTDPAPEPARTEEETDES